jgi:hypothetical protein
VQYLGTQGFFGTYDANPHGKITSAMAQAWASAAAEWLVNRPVDLDARSKTMLIAEQADGAGLTAEEFIALLSSALKQASVSVPTKELRALAGLGLQRPISRANACRLIFALGNR